MCQSRTRFKRTLRECRQNEETIHASAHTNSPMENDMTLFRKSVKKDSNARVPLAPVVDNCMVTRKFVICGKLITKHCLKGNAAC